ncbi:uncharacterized protein IUM83_05079 [Phytophthora cinnamomi]|uniref:uncharacterized protein n=1 Tax=Phytophthora cinnamomi TaxID=4785 RepID=UPI00355A6EFC|nr:hypothetical protein IUM83_05079 [Phytophthora cinnamomi]
MSRLTPLELREVDLDAVLEFVDSFSVDNDGPGKGSTATERLQANDSIATSSSIAFPDDHVELKRRKARLKAQRQYHNKIQKLQRLRDQVAMLEAKIRVLSAQKQISSSFSPEFKCASHKMKLLIQSRELQTQLEAERSLLQKLLSDSCLQLMTLRDILNAEHQLYLANSSYFMVFKPLTPADCHMMSMQAQAEIANYSVIATSLGHTRAVCEWAEKRFTNLGTFFTSIQKTLYHKSAQVISTQTWRVFTTQWEKLFSPGMKARSRLVQHIDDDNILFSQDFSATRMLPRDAEPSEVVMMALVSKQSTDAGYLIAHRGLRRDAVEAQDLLKTSAHDHRSEVWLEHFCWINLEQTGEHCQVTIGGISSASRATSYFWVTEFIQFALRWEMVVFGPRFVLPQ